MGRFIIYYKHYLHVKVDDDVDGEGRVSPAGVGPGEGRLRPGGGRVPAAHSSRVQRLLVLADRAPGRPDQTPVEGGDGIQGLWIDAQSFIVWHCIKPILGHFDNEILRVDSYVSNLVLEWNEFKQLRSGWCVHF